MSKFLTAAILAPLAFMAAPAGAAPAKATGANAPDGCRIQAEKRGDRQFLSAVADRGLTGRYELTATITSSDGETRSTLAGAVGPSPWRRDNLSRIVVESGEGLIAQLNVYGSDGRLVCQDNLRGGLRGARRMTTQNAIAARWSNR